jgi:hypothetical protein
MDSCPVVWNGSHATVSEAELFNGLSGIFKAKHMIGVFSRMVLLVP